MLLYSTNSFYVNIKVSFIEETGKREGRSGPVESGQIRLPI
jgi:hypothetical protein